MKPLYTKYRPHKLADMVGQDAVATSLGKIIARRESQAFLFSGPSGVGKTTLARIAARMLGCQRNDIVEVPAAVYTGVDDMRQIQKMADYRPFGASKHRAIIFDECHRLSGQAWDSLLKIIEEPPAHISWFFCTTSITKVPTTIKTRCTSFALQEVPDKVLGTLFGRVCEQEDITLPADIGDMIVKEAHGSPRQLLVNLAACRDVTDRKTAAIILKTVIDSNKVLELCRYLAKGGSWGKAMEIIARLEGESPESIRIVVCNYMGAAAKKTRVDREAVHFLKILDAFDTSYNQSEGTAPLMLSIGRVLFGAE